MASDRTRSPQMRMFKYAPIRFWLLHDDEEWVDAVHATEAAIANDRRNALLSVSEWLYFRYADHGLPLRGDEFMRFPHERLQAALTDGDGSGTTGGTLEMEMQAWAANGQQIFDLSPISALFLNTDASAVPVSSIKYRYESFYLYWGEHLKLPSADSSRYIDGCFVHSVDWRKFANGDLLGHKATRLASEPQTLELTFTSTLPDDHRWAEASLLVNMCLEAEGVFSALLELTDETTFAQVLRDVDSDAFYETALARRWRTALPAAVSMAANCLCYLCSDDAEIMETYGGSAPPKLVAMAKSTRETERRRASSKLANLGFRTIHLCGTELAKRAQLKPHSRELPPHWRSGHWHHVRHGPGRSLVRLQWFAGLIVHKEKAQDKPADGHIYVP